jgi:hypothetical protein
MLTGSNLGRDLNETEEEMAEALIHSLANPVPSIPLLNGDSLRDPLPTQASEFPKSEVKRGQMLPSLCAKKVDLGCLESKPGKQGRICKHSCSGSGEQTAQWLQRLESLATLPEYYRDPTVRVIGEVGLTDKSAKPDKYPQRRH